MSAAALHRSCAQPRAVALWGDGFAEDGLFDLWSVDSWRLCSPDEYVLLFPRLVPQDGHCPADLRAHLETCVSVRAWRLSELDKHVPCPRLRSSVPDLSWGRQNHPDWFADDDTVTCLLRRLGMLRTFPHRLAAERSLLEFLDGILVDIQQRREPAWDSRSEALLAFGAALHPAYIWPKAAVSEARGTTAGWLGVLERGRTALMPLQVAEYVLDAVAGDGPTTDQQLVGMAGGSSNLGLLRRAAKRRLSGADATVRLAPGSLSRAGIFARPSLAPHAEGIPI